MVYVLVYVDINVSVYVYMYVYMYTYMCVCECLSVCTHSAAVRVFIYGVRTGAQGGDLDGGASSV